MGQHAACGAGASLKLSWVRLHGLLLLAPSSPSMSLGYSPLPLLSHYYDPLAGGTLHLEHCVIVTMCPMLRQWVQHYAAAPASQDGDLDIQQVKPRAALLVTCFYRIAILAKQLARAQGSS